MGYFTLSQNPESPRTNALTDNDLFTRRTTEDLRGALRLMGLQLIGPNRKGKNHGAVPPNDEPDEARGRSRPEA